MTVIRYSRGWSLAHCGFLLLQVLMLLFVIGYGLRVALAQSSPKKFFSAATTNSTNVFAKKGLLQSVYADNTSATLAFLKLYDKATAPTCGTDIPFWTIPIPVSNGQQVVSVPINGILLQNGLGFCITGALADADATASVTGIVVNFGLTGR